MNRGEDLLWLHIASHGSPDQGIVLSHPQRPLYGLNPEYLHAMLDESGIRYRIVVISACYSGTFVGKLANSTSLIATASASSRKSYGCGSQSDITYFSKALYLGALRKTRSLLEAFHLAPQIVYEQESALHLDHSYPQVRSGIEIEALLR